MKYSCLIIADAHKNMSGAVYKLLQDFFETVVIVENGESLLESVAALKPDLIIVDLSLPITGRENILEYLRSLDVPPCAKIIVLSIYDEEEVIRDAFAAGVMGYVLKGAAATDLITAVKEVFDNRRYISPGLMPEGQAIT